MGCEGWWLKLVAGAANCRLLSLLFRFVFGDRCSATVVAREWWWVAVSCDWLRCWCYCGVARWWNAWWCSVGGSRGLWLVV